MQFAGMKMADDITDGAKQFCVQRQRTDGENELVTIAVAYTGVKMSLTRTEERLGVIPLNNIRSWNSFTESSKEGELAGILFEVARPGKEDALIRFYTPQGKEIFKALGERPLLPDRIPLALLRATRCRACRRAVGPNLQAGRVPRHPGPDGGG